MYDRSSTADTFDDAMLGMFDWKEGPFNDSSYSGISNAVCRDWPLYASQKRSLTHWGWTKVISGRSSGLRSHLSHRSASNCMIKCGHMIVEIRMPWTLQVIASVWPKKVCVAVAVLRKVPLTLGTKWEDKCIYSKYCLNLDLHTKLHSVHGYVYRVYFFLFFLDKIWWKTRNDLKGIKSTSSRSLTWE